MGKGKRDKGKSKANKKKQVPLPTTVEELLQLAEAELIKCEPVKALAILKQALTLNPNHTPSLDLIGHAFAEAGDQTQAKAALMKSCQLEPESSFEKWMFLGQFVEGLEAVKCFEKGVQVMIAQRVQLMQRQQSLPAGEEKTQMEEDLKHLTRQISSGYCSAVEIFQTDCCDLPTAEEQCERLIGLALTTCPDNPEAIYALANFRFLQQRKGEALAALQKCYDVLSAESEASGHEIAVQTSGLSEGAGKLALELGQFEIAAELLELALKEDDSVTQLWFLAGFCYSKTGELVLARDYLQTAQQKLTQEPDPALEEDVTRAVAEVAAAIAKLPPDALAELEHGGTDPLEDGVVENGEDTEMI